MMDVAIYVQGKYAKATYANENYNVRLWAGVEMLRNELGKKGIDVGYTGAATVTECRIILVSIVSMLDWYSFLSERLLWPMGDYRVIIGGGGLMNVRPFLNHADVFCFGRAEGFIFDLINSELKGDKLSHPSVCYSEDFSDDETYEICQSEKPYEGKFTLPDGREYSEGSIGCQRRCLFCGYTWHRKNSRGNQCDNFSLFDKTSMEKTLFELDLKNPDSWGDSGKMTFGLDGVSERLRRMVNKPISNQMLWDFLTGMAMKSKKPAEIFLYNLVGLPTEKDEDFFELKEILERFAKDFWAKLEFAKEFKGMRFVVHSTPFSPMPCTPAATWPAKYHDWGGHGVSAKMKIRSIFPSQIARLENLSVLLSERVEGLPTHILNMLVLRGTEEDSDVIERLSTSKAFWSSSVKVKRATLERVVDVSRLYKEYTWENLPTRYLKGWMDNEKLKAIDQVARKKIGGF